MQFSVSHSKHWFILAFSVIGVILISLLLILWRSRDGGGVTPQATTALIPTLTPANIALHTVTPETCGNTGPATIDVHGTNLDERTVIRLENPALTSITPMSGTQYLDATHTSVTFDLDGVAPGTYSVVAEKPGGGRAELTAGFRVVDGAVARLSTRIDLPANFLEDGMGSFKIEYANTGTVDMAAPLFELISRGGVPITITPDQPMFSHPTTIYLFLSASDERLDILPAGARGSITVYAWGSGPLDFALTPLPLSAPIPWDSLKPLYMPPEASVAEFDPIWQAIRSQLGETGSDLRANLLALHTDLGTVSGSMSPLADLTVVEWQAEVAAEMGQTMPSLQELSSGRDSVIPVPHQEQPTSASPDDEPTPCAGPIISFPEPTPMPSSQSASDENTPPDAPPHMKTVFDEPPGPSLPVNITSVGGTTTGGTGEGVRIGVVDADLWTIWPNPGTGSNGGWDGSDGTMSRWQNRHPFIDWTMTRK